VVADPVVVRAVTPGLPALISPLAVVVDTDGVWVVAWWLLGPALVARVSPLVVTADLADVLDARKLLEIAPPELRTTPAAGGADPTDAPDSGLVRLSDACPRL
jgi:hypothetical protein